jgi:hypothetical protein
MNTVRYCYNCNHLTTGKPLFCGHCGRTYNVKLCPRLHTNPRSAEVCSQCGSRDLSTPQPRVPLWVPVVEFLVSVIPGVVLTVVSVLLVVLFIAQLLHSPRMLFAFVMLAIALGILWWVWSELPSWFRSAIYWILKRKRDGDERRDRR